MAIIGIDPGLTGALAVINGELAYILDTPSGKVNGKTAYFEAEMGDLLDGIVDANRSDFHVFIERQQAMKGQGVSSTFRTGYGYGLWRGLIAGLNLQLTEVSPASWKKAVGLPTGSDKNASRKRAQELFPQLTRDLARVKDHGRADALLIAEHGRRILS